MKTIFSLALVFTLALSTAATAAPEKAAAKPAKESAAEKKDKYPLYGEVVSVNSRTLIIKGGEGKEDRKFTITAATEISKNDKPAKAEDIKVGQWVGGYVDKEESGNDKLLKLNLSVKQKSDKPAAKKEEKAEATKPKVDATKKKAA